MYILIRAQGEYKFFLKSRQKIEEEINRNVWDVSKMQNQFSNIKISV